jgi:hypothetical protein
MYSPTFWKCPPPLGFTIDCKTWGKVITKLYICWSSNIGGRGLLHTYMFKREIHRYKVSSKCISELSHSVFKSTLKIPCHHYMKDCLPVWFSLHLIMHNDICAQLNCCISSCIKKHPWDIIGVKPWIITFY